jgi:hypothetical protein
MSQMISGKSLHWVAITCPTFLKCRTRRHFLFVPQNIYWIHAGYSKHFVTDREE